MDWLKNLATNVYSGVNKVGSYLGDVFNQGNANTAGLFNSTYAGGASKPATPVQTAVNNAYINNQSFVPGKAQMTPIPAASPWDTTQGLMKDNKATITSQAAFDGMNTARQVASNASPAFTPYQATPQYTPYEIGNYRSALPAVTGGQDSRVSTKAQGVPFMDENGNLVTPKAGFSGQTGFGSGLQSFSTQGVAGLPGSGGSAYTGLLTGTSGLGTPSAVTVEDETPAGKKKATLNYTPANFSPAPTLPGGMQQAQQVAQTAQGGMTPFVPPSEQLNVKGSPTVDLGALDTMKASTGDAQINIGTNDFESFKQNFSKAYEANLAKINAETVIPENLVQDTPEQQAYLEQSEDPFGYKQAMDQFRSSQTDLTNLHTQQVDVLKQIQAANQTFTSIVSDTKTNPDLPKGLAMRRINEIQKTQKTKIDELLGMADVIKAQIDNQNEIVNRNFNIATQAKNDNQKAEERDLAKFKLFVDSGAIGAFTDADIKKYAAITGLSTSVIKKMKDSAKNPDLDIYTTTDDLGTVRGIDKKTGKTVWTQSGVGGTKTVPQQDIKEYQAKASTFANRLEAGGEILKNTAKLIQGYDPVKLQAYVTASDISAILSNKLIPDDVRSWIQASRDTINATLRRESGAVISPSEFANARAQYLVMPGDSDNVINQKFENMRLNKESYIKEAGAAYTPYTRMNAIQPDTTSNGQTKVYNGITYKAINGVWTPQ